MDRYEKRSYRYLFPAARAQALIILYFLWSFLWMAKSAWAENPPNVLFIIVDDLRPEMGCYGTKAIQTPRIDALAKNALVLHRAYCQEAV